MEEEIYRGLIERGLPPHVAEGIVMNLRDESGLDPGINETSPIVPGSRGGFGLAQWTGPRRKELERFAAETGRDVSDTEMQLDFLVQELQGPERSAFDATMATATPGDAAAAFATNYLRPAKTHLDRRVASYTGGGYGDAGYSGGGAGYGNAFRGSQQPGTDINALLASLEQQKPERPKLGLAWQGHDPEDSLMMSWRNLGWG